MSAEENKSIVRRFNEEVFGGGDVDAVDRYLAPDILNHPTGVRGTEDWKRIVRHTKSHFPTSSMTIEHLIAEDDIVMIHITWSGTQQGEIRMPWGTIPPSGKSYTVQHVHIYRIVDGKIAEHWAVREDLGLLLQMGALP